jgi:uncharacterized membrane protein YgcG
MKKYLAALAAMLCLCTALPARADIFYAVSNYDNGSIGMIEKTGSANNAYTVTKDLSVGLGVDGWGFTFRDHDGAERAMIRDYQYGPNDSVYVWDPLDWKRPKVNRNDWGSNIHAVAENGRYLYIATYESYVKGVQGQNTGEVARIDMRNGYAPDPKRYRYEAFDSGGQLSSPHAEAIHIQGERVYVLFGISFQGVDDYKPSEILEFDLDLNLLRTFKLEDTQSNISGKNPLHMAYYGGKLYVACIGGYQGENSWGDIWEVDISDGSPAAPKQVLDGHDIPYNLGGGETAASGMYGIQFASDGTAYLLVGSYDTAYVFRARLFVTTAAKLAAGDVGEADVAASYTKYEGASWDILYDEEESTLWVMAGRVLQARSKNGKTLYKTFQPIDLGDNIYSISLLRGDAVKPASPNLPGAPAHVSTSAAKFLDQGDRTALVAASGLTEDSIAAAGGVLTVNKDKAYASAKNVYPDAEFSNVKPLPISSTDVNTAGNIAAVAYEVTGASLMAASPSAVRVMTSALEKAFTYASGGFADGTFRIMSGANDAGTIANASAKHTGMMADAPGKYTLVLFVADGGDYDLDGEKDGKVLVESEIVGTKTALGNGSGNGNGNGNGNGGGESGGGGGCDAGFGWAVLLMLALGSVSGLRKKNRP